MNYNEIFNTFFHKFKFTNSQLNIINLFLTDWLSSRKYNADFENNTAEELAEILRIFYAEVRNKKGEVYSKNTFAGIRASISRHLQSPPHKKNFSIVTDKEFFQANKIFLASLKTYRMAGEDRASSYPVISRCDLDKVRCENAFNLNNAEQLQQKVWWDLHFNFARRGRENDRNMTKDSFRIATDSTGKEFIELTHNEFTKNHRADDDVEIYPRCYSNNTPMCPVVSFKKYLQKLNHKNNFLWQRPKKTYVESTTEWYGNVPLGVNSLGKMMQVISKRLSLSKVFTNHSVRSTAITVLSDAGIEARHIAKVSGHRSLLSIDNYARDASEEQKRNFSAILQNTEPTSNTSTDHSFKCEGKPCSSTNTTCTNTSQFSSSNNSSAPSSLWLQNCVINGNISIVSHHRES